MKPRRQYGSKCMSKKHNRAARLMTLLARQDNGLLTDAEAVELADLREGATHG